MGACYRRPNPVAVHHLTIALISAGLLMSTHGREAAAQPAASYDTLLFRALTWRNIGPYRGGRSVAVAGSPSRPYEYWFGTTGGGVFKTTDGGIHWTAPSDKYFGGTVGGDRRQRIQSRHRVRRYGRSTTFAAMCRTATACTRRPTAGRRGPTSGSPTRDRSRESASIRTIRTLSTSALSATCGRRTRARALQDDRRWKELGRRSCSGTTRLASRTWSSTRRTRARSTQRSGRPAANRGSW